MGQQLGKASYKDEIKPFQNLSNKAMDAVWQKFNIIADNWGVDEAQFIRICSVLADELETDEADLEPKSRACFQMFDTDLNGSVDALEFLAAFAMMSGMDDDAKVTFIFNCYDFSETKSLTIDEMTLSLKSTLVGLAKCSEVESPSLPKIEGLSQLAFKAAKSDPTSGKIPMTNFLTYCTTNPAIASWSNYFDDPEDQTEVLNMRDEDLDEEANPVERSEKQEIANNAETEEDMFAMEEATDGDQFMAVKPWLGAVQNSVPTEAPADNPSAPDSQLELQWVHGYRAQDARNNLRYTGDGDIAYHAAAVGIIYSAPSEASPEPKQRFNVDHTDDIISFALHPDGTKIATGEMGKRPKIVVWDTKTMDSIVVIKGFHKRAVQHLAFSPDGAQLASVGQDNQNSLAVYDWAAKKKLFSGKGDTNKVLDCRWGSNDRLATCGVKHVWFWTKNGKKTFKKKKGLFGKKGKIQTLPCLSTLDSADEMVSGTVSGDIYLWVGRNCKKAVKAHEKTVNAFYYCAKNNLLVSGGKDGKVKLWSRTLVPKAEFDIASIGSTQPSIRSVCLSASGERLLVGTWGSEIFEMSATDGSDLNKDAGEEAVGKGPLMVGHYKDEVWGLAVHPTKAEYCTTGDDKTVRVWDIATNKMLRMTTIDCMARSCAYSNDGTKIAVGMGGSVGRGKQRQDGAFKVLNEADLSIVYEKKESKEWIQDIKFSPDGSVIAVGSHDNKIYLHNASDGELKFTCEAHNSYITHVDFSKDGTAMQSNCGAYELLYFDVATGEQKKDGASEYKDKGWASQTCTLGWPVQGIWPAFSDGTDVNAVDRSKSEQLLVTSDDFGLVKMLRYPCLTKGCSFNEYRGHSSHVTNVRFANNDSHVISVGGNDRCVFQWAVEHDDGMESGEEEQPAEAEASDAAATDSTPEGAEGEGEGIAVKADEDAEDQPDDLEDLQEDYKSAEVMNRSANAEVHNNEDMSALFDIEDAGEGDQFTAVKPWTGTINSTKPSNPPKEDTSAPTEQLQLEWIHGYRAQDARSNLFYNADGDICYSAAAAGIILNKKKWTQTYNLDHTDDILCVAMHPSGRYVATGQMGRRPSIIVWDAATGQTVSKMKCGRRAVCRLAFSNDGKMLAAVGQDDNHSVYVYTWADAALKCRGKGDSNKVLDVTFTPDDTGLVTCGVKHFKLWTFKGRNMKFKKGLFGKKAKIQPILSARFVKQDDTFAAVLGAADGSLYKLDGRKVDQVVEAHTGAVNSLYTIPSGPNAGGLISGGADGLVKLWDASLSLIDVGENPDGTSRTIDLTKRDGNECFKPRVRAVCMSSDAAKILVGTEGSEIFEFDARIDPEAPTFGKNVNEDRGALISGHCRDELWGLAMHPTKAEYCTVGDDRTVRVWDAKTRTKIKQVKLNEFARACAYSPDGTLIAVGLGGSVGRGKRKRDGAFKILNESDLSVVYEGHESKEWISDVKFSPDGVTLAIGSHDNVIYLHNTTDWSVRGQCEKHNSYITHFDFSKDSQYLQSNCGAYELLYFDANTAAHEPKSSLLKDVDWASQTSVLGWAVQGIWPPCADGTDINAIDLSKSGQILATADDFGKVKLMRYPCISKGNGAHEYRGHSSHVTNVRFSTNDSHVVSVGGNDRCIFQWSVEGDEDEDDAPEAGAEATDDDLLDGLDAFAMEEATGGDQFTAVKPWLGALVPPSAPAKENSAAPATNLDLEFIHGYRAQDARSNLFYNPNGNMCYSAAGVGIVMDKNTRTQHFYTGHDDDIISLAISPDGRFVASGQKGRRPRVHVWDSATGGAVCTLPVFHRRGIPCVTFSPDGKMIASVGQDNNNSIGLYKTCTGEWTDGTKEATAKGDQNKVLFVHFTGLEEYPLVTGGVKHQKFWKIDQRLRCKKGIFGKKGKIQPILCAATVGGAVISGTVTGDLYVWGGRTVVKAVKAHTASVNTLFATEDGVVSGGKDGHVKVWEVNAEGEYNCKADFDMNDAPSQPIDSSIRSVCMNEHGTSLLVGTRGSEIYELQMDTASGSSACLISQAHCADELWGLATHPTNPDLYATCGDDKTVRVWSVKQKACIALCTLDCLARALAWSPDGTQIAVGLGGSVGRGKYKKDGAYVVCSFEEQDKRLSVIVEGHEAKEWISDLKYSADGSILAIGSHDNKIYLHDAKKNYAVKAKCEAHNSYITHIDISSDSSYIRSTCGAYELLFHDATSGKQDPGGATKCKDMQFSSETCPLGWAVQGIWPAESDGTDINAVDQSHSGGLLATADDFGKVKVFNYPCLSKGNKFVEGKGHSSHVTNVRFTQDDSHMLTTGGNDRSVFQWRL